MVGNGLVHYCYLVLVVCDTNVVIHDLINQAENLRVQQTICPELDRNIFYILIFLQGTWAAERQLNVITRTLDPFIF